MTVEVTQSVVHQLESKLAEHRKAEAKLREAKEILAAHKAEIDKLFLEHADELLEESKKSRQFKNGTIRLESKSEVKVPTKIAIDQLVQELHQHEMDNAVEVSRKLVMGIRGYRMLERSKHGRKILKDYRISLLEKESVKVVTG